MYLNETQGKCFCREHLFHWTCQDGMKTVNNQRGLDRLFVETLQNKTRENVPTKKSSIFKQNQYTYIQI